MISADFYPTLQTYADGEIERTDIINNLYDNDVVGSPYYLGYIEHDDFPKSFGVSLVDYARGMVFNRIESNHSWGYCFNKNVYNSTGTTPNLAIIQDTNGHAESGGDRYCFLNKIKMAQQNSVNTVSMQLRFMYVPTADIDDSGTTYFNQGYSFTYDTVTATINQIKNMIDGTANIYGSWTRNNITYPAIKYSDFNEYGLALVQSTDSTMTVAICISYVNIGDSGRYSYGESTNVYCPVFPFFEHDYEDKHILAAQGAGLTEDPTIAWYQNLGIIRPHTNFGMTYDNQLYMFAPYPYDILVEDLPTYNLYQRSGLVKGQYFLQNYAVYSGYVAFYAYAHYDLKDIYTMMLYYHKIYTNGVVFSKSYSTDISVATFDDHDGATGNRLSDDYATISPQLREWQQPDKDIAVNEYDPTTKPEYDPSGGDDGTDSGGDDIRTTDWSVTPVSAANNFITLYGLNYKTLSDFGQKMWAQLADPEFWQMVGTAFTNDFSINPADMMRYFVSLRFFPFDLSSLSNTLASGIYIGRAATPIRPTIGQDIPNPIRITNNIAQLSGGRLTIRRYYNDFRDYEPCTTVQIHVPFCGSVDVPASEVMGHEMDLTYKIDLQTGAMLAVLGVASNTYYVIATLAGTCGASIPITANNNIEFLQRIATVGSGIIGGGVSGAVKGATVGGEVGAVVGAVAGTVGGGVGALAGLPPVTVHKQGNASGFANLGGVPYAYATVQRGRFERPANYGHTTGFACDFSATLGSLSGFTVCDNVDTSGLTCNADERGEIKRLLESGVYV